MLSSFIKSDSEFVENKHTGRYVSNLNFDVNRSLHDRYEYVHKYFFNREVKNLRQKALIYEGSRTSNPNKRNYFLTSALELQEEFNGFPNIDRNEELLDQISINTFFDVLSVRFNPEKHNNDIFKVCFKFSSGITKNITLRNDVVHNLFYSNNKKL